MPTTLVSVLAAFALSAGPRTDQAEAQSVTLRFQIIEADGFTETDPAIADVQEVLADLFRFQGYRLAGEAVVRVEGGVFSPTVEYSNGAVFRFDGGAFSQTVASSNGQVYTITAGASGFLDDGSDPASGQFQISDLTLWVTETSPILQTSFSLPLGQTVVVGSARPSSDGPTLILVVRLLAL